MKNTPQKPIFLRFPFVLLLKLQKSLKFSSQFFIHLSNGSIQIKQPSTKFPKVSFKGRHHSKILLLQDHVQALFTTTVRFATTNEVATYSNGSLAQLRIINANRSPKAIVSVLIKFGLETPFGKVTGRCGMDFELLSKSLTFEMSKPATSTVFRTAIENFVKARPVS